MALALWRGGQAYGQSVPAPVSEGLARLDRAICLQQWEQAIGVTSELMATANISPAYRQELLSFRRQLQTWSIQPTPPSTQASCDRTLPLFLTLAEPAAPEPQPLDWNRALATLRNPRPIIQLDNEFEPTDTIIPLELMVSSPDALTNFASPMDTRDGFTVVGGSLDRNQQVYSVLARFGDRVSLEANVTRGDLSSTLQVFMFDQSGRLLTQQGNAASQVYMQDIVISKTDVYFVAVSPQGTTPILDSQGQLIDWQTTGGNNRFDYTLTLTGVTPYQALLP
ncbi:hypothetical protein N836_27405 [Leptolyngbya sp. Heron Island J]|uniref:hypothetical protein n=1 Tax=Leptolyngbya sp. Heron Island J TaxID=1385935 RepID=UPI0003B9CB2E|nr:hypothetical protein [Leptolyngbya sp. Heron Island J]ESA32320.1 hypothetical protein N836_27405 [Leptolyngbya sp. Heron Island J]